MQYTQKLNKTIQVRYNADIVPDCPVCGSRCKSGREIASHIGVLQSLVWSWRGRGLNSYSGLYRDNERQGTWGVTAQYYCQDEVNMWLVANPKRLNGRVPASWSLVKDDDGRVVSAIPTHVSSAHANTTLYGEFINNLVASLNPRLL